MTEPITLTIDEMIIRMNQARAELEASFARVDDMLLAAASNATDWAIKDHLAHLAIWAEGIAATLRGEPRWEAMGLTAEFVETHDIDEINAEIFEQHEARSLEEVRAMFAAAHQSVISALAKLSDADLLRPYRSFQPQDTDESDTSLIWERIEGNTFGHYQEHQVWIQEWLARHGE